MLVFRKKNNDLVVLKEKAEKRLYLESTFYRHLADAVNRCLRVNTIPKEMYKDGNLVDNGRFYLVDRKRRYCFYQNDWDSYDINRDYFNVGMPVVLSFSWLQDNDEYDSLLDNWNYLPLWEEGIYGKSYKITITLADGTKFVEAKGESRNEAVAKVIKAGIYFLKNVDLSSISA